MSKLILNPGIQDVVYNGNSCSLYYNQEKIWPTQVVPTEVTIGTQIWKTGMLDIDDGQGGVVTPSVDNIAAHDYILDPQGNHYPIPSIKYYTYTAANRICAANYPGWHVAVATDFNKLFTTLGINNNNYQTELGKILRTDSICNDIKNGVVTPTNEYGVGIYCGGAVFTRSSDSVKEFSTWCPITLVTSGSLNPSFAFLGPHASGGIPGGIKSTSSSFSMAQPGYSSITNLGYIRSVNSMYHPIKLVKDAT